MLADLPRSIDRGHIEAEYATRINPGIQAGDMVRIRERGGRWVCAEVLLVTKTGAPGAVALEEPIGFPMAIAEELGCVVLLLTEQADHFTDLFTDKQWEVDYDGSDCGPSPGYAARFKLVFGRNED